MKSHSIEVRVLGAEDAGAMSRIEAEVFDGPLDPQWTAEFLRDPRLHLAIASDAEKVVGFASGVHYHHPDKPPELFVNEVGVAPGYQGLGIGRQVLGALLHRAREVGCREAWVLTSRTNEPAMRLYSGLGGRPASEEQVMFTFNLEERQDPLA